MAKKDRESILVLSMFAVLAMGFLFLWWMFIYEKPEINDNTLFPETSQTAQQDSIGTELVKQNDYQGIKAETIMFRQQLFDVVVIDLTVHEVELFWKSSADSTYGNIGALKNDLNAQGKQLLWAMNAGMYLQDQSPQGLFINQYKKEQFLDLGDGYGNFYLKPNGVFYISDDYAGVVESEVFPSLDSAMIRCATQSGPMLLINGEIHPAFREGSTNTFVRNGVGVIEDHKIVCAISKQLVNFFDFAMLFKEKFGCKDALYLDGVISKMYSPALNRNNLDGTLGPILAITEPLASASP